MLYTLYAENIETHKRRFMGGMFLSLNDCSTYVNSLADIGTWPLDCLPVAIHAMEMTCFCYFYDHDDWDYIGDMIFQPEGKSNVITFTPEEVK